MTKNKCKECATDKTACESCVDNPKYANVPRTSKFSLYKPTCPFGMTDCVVDPAYIRFHYPDWYKSLYGDMTVEQASQKHCGKSKSVWDCYDDEDK